jgi:hypothetical protein
LVETLLHCPQICTKGPLIIRPTHNHLRSANTLLRDFFFQKLYFSLPFHRTM